MKNSVSFFGVLKVNFIHPVPLDVNASTQNVGKDKLIVFSITHL